MDFGIRFKKLRVDKKLTQFQLAKILDISKSNISKYETGNVEPNLETLVKISKYFGVSTDYLLGNEIEKIDYVTPDVISPNIGKMISILRTERKLTQRDLASLLNVSNGAVGMWEIGQRQPDLNMLIVIAKFFNVSTDYLLGIDHSEKKNNLILQTDSIQLSPNQKSLLRAFDQCNEECQQYLIAKAHVLAVEGISAVATGEYGKYVDEGKKSSPLNGAEETGI